MSRGLASAQLRDFEEVRTACDRAETITQLHTAADAALRSFGFPWFALVDDGDIAKDRPDCLMMTNYPASWVDEVIRDHLYRHDPVHAASIRSPAGLCWSRIGELIVPTQLQISVFERGRRHGLHSGFTIPFRVAGERGAFFTVSRRRASPFTFAEATSAQLLGTILFERAHKLARGQCVRARGAVLSRRQIDCLGWIAAGKSEWEIGIILGLSPSTVHDYVETARRRYQVKTRSQLVLAAARDGFVSLNHLT